MDDICREVVLEKAKSSISVPTDNEWDCGYNTAMAEMQEFIKQLPSADVQPVRRGHWIWKERHRNSLRVVKGIDRYGKEGDLQIHEEYKEKVNYCSECGKQGHEVSLNFCPNCGARMDGGAENG